MAQLAVMEVWTSFGPTDPADTLGKTLTVGAISTRYDLRTTLWSTSHFSLLLDIPPRHIHLGSVLSRLCYYP